MAHPTRDDFGVLCDYWSGGALRDATAGELAASLAAQDSARGIVVVDRTACTVQPRGASHLTVDRTVAPPRTLAEAAAHSG